MREILYPGFQSASGVQTVIGRDAIPQALPATVTVSTRKKNFKKCESPSYLISNHFFGSIEEELRSRRLVDHAPAPLISSSFYYKDALYENASRTLIIMFRFLLALLCLASSWLPSTAARLLDVEGSDIGRLTVKLRFFEYSTSTSEEEEDEDVETSREPVAIFERECASPTLLRETVQIVNDLGQNKKLYPAIPKAKIDVTVDVPL